LEIRQQPLTTIHNLQNELGPILMGLARELKSMKVLCWIDSWLESFFNTLKN